MVIKGLTFQFLAYGALTRAHDTMFAKYFTNKMYQFSVHNDKI